MFKKFMVVGIVVAVGVLVAGCSQQTPEVKTEAASPQSLICKGVVYGNYYMPESTYYDTHVIGPVAGAVVSLVGSYETHSAVTNDLGEYVFENVKYGNYRVEATKEGYQRGERYLITENAFMFGAADASSVNASAVPDGTIFTVDLDMFINPVMRSVSPSPYSTIETDAVFTITFNKPMDTSTVRPRFVSGGIRTFAAGDTVSVATAWSNNDTVLTITPSSPLLPNLGYLLYLGPTKFAQVKDKEGYMLATSTTYYEGVPVEENGNVIENNDYFIYYTASGGAPGAVSNLMVTVNGKPFTSEAGVNYLDLYNTSNTVDLHCDPPSSGGPVTGYRFYAAIDSASASNYVLIGWSESNYYTRTILQLISSLYNGVVDPVSTGNYPFVNKPVYFKAVAFNGDGESTQEASTGAIKELMGPVVDVDAYSGRAGGGYAAEVLDNNYYLPELLAGTDTKIAYIAFVDLVDPATVIAGNFTHSAGTVTGATLLTSSGLDLNPFGFSSPVIFSIVKITSDTDFAPGHTITVEPGVKDLAGNPTVAGEIATVL